MIYFDGKSLAFFEVSSLRLHLCVIFLPPLACGNKRWSSCLTWVTQSHPEVRGVIEAKRGIMRSSYLSLTHSSQGWQWDQLQTNNKECILISSHSQKLKSWACKWRIRKLVTDIWILCSARKSDGLIIIFLVDVCSSFHSICLLCLSVGALKRLGFSLMILVSQSEWLPVHPHSRLIYSPYSLSHLLLCSQVLLVSLYPAMVHSYLCC